MRHGDRVAGLMVNSAAFLEAMFATAKLGAVFVPINFRLAAVVALNDGARVTDDDLIGYARERLAHFKCPTRVEYVAELPRNATGKVLKTALRRAYGGSDGAVQR